MMQMLSHGLISGALFLCVGVLYDRMHSREIGAYGGVINTMPKFAALMVLFGLANAGLPGTSGFVGEFFVILGTFHADSWLAFLAATTLILGAAYTLWMIKRVVFGEVANEPRRGAHGRRSRASSGCSMLLAIAVLLVGIWPAPLVDAMDASIGQLLNHVGQPKLVEGRTRHGCQLRRRRSGDLPRARDLRRAARRRVPCATTSARRPTCSRCWR